MVVAKSVAGPAPAGTEGGRRPTGVPAGAADSPDPEVVARPTRRRLSVAYKLKVLETVEALRARGQGAVGAYLRQEGLYYSSVRDWARLRDQGRLTARTRGPREKSRDALLAELQDRGICCAVEAEYPVTYKGRVLGKHRVDLVVEGKVLLELKAVLGPLPRIFVAQAISERRAARLPVALLVNFGDVSLQVRRLEDRNSDDVQVPDQRL